MPPLSKLVLKPKTAKIKRIYRRKPVWEKILQALLKQIEEHPEQIIDLLSRIVALCEKMQETNPDFFPKLLKILKPKE